MSPAQVAIYWWFSVETATLGGAKREMEGSLMYAQQDFNVYQVNRCVDMSKQVCNLKLQSF